MFTTNRDAFAPKQTKKPERHGEKLKQFYHPPIPFPQGLRRTGEAKAVKTFFTTKHTETTKFGKSRSQELPSQGAEAESECNGELKVAGRDRVLATIRFGPDCGGGS